MNKDMKILKKLISLNFIMILLIGLVQPVFADELEDDKKIIKIGYVPECGLIVHNNLVGQQGYGVDYFELLENYTGHEYEYIPCLWGNREKYLDNGIIDVLCPILKTAEREDKYLYTADAFLHENIVLFTLKESDIMFDDFEGINNSNIGIAKDSAYIPYLEQYLKDNNITAQYVYYDDIDMEISDALQQGVFDIAVNGSTTPMENSKIIAQLGVVSSYLISNQDNQNIIDELDAGMQELLEDDFMAVNNLHIENFNGNIFAKPAITKDEDTLLTEKSIFNIAYSSNHFPYQYQNEKGEAAGIVVDVMDLILKNKDITLNYITHENITNENIGTIDMSICIEHELDGFTSTIPFYELPLVSIAKRSVNINENSKIGSNNYNNIRLSTEDIIYYDNLDAIETPFLENELDQIIVSSIGGNYILRNENTNSYKIEPLIASLPLTIKFSNSEKEFVPIFNKLINQLDLNSVEIIILEHVSHIEKDFNLIDQLQENSSYILAIIAGLIVLILIVVNNKKKTLLSLLNYDNLTGLISDYNYFKQSNELLANSKPEDYIALAVDVDNFKNINTSYGYEKGSSILQELSIVLKDCFNEDALITRINGDLFSIFIKNTEENHEFIQKLGKIHTITSSDKSEVYSISLSIGMYVIDDTSLSSQQITDCANLARIKSKPYFESVISLYTKEMMLEQIVNTSIVTSMQKAMDDEQFYIVLQPKYCAVTSKIVGAEALVRWKKEDGDTVFPDKFIPVFEANGFITKLDYYVFEKVCQFIQAHKNEVDNIRISVNLSCVTILDDSLQENIMKMLNKYSIKCSQIEFEITESAFVKQFERVVAKVAYFRQLGISVSVDDFGSGLSSFGRLREVNVNALKIDKDCIDYSGTEKGTVILKGIIDIAKMLHLKTIAEGVETAENVELLKKLGCDEIQGYYFSKPVERIEFLKLLENDNMFTNKIS